MSIGKLRKDDADKIDHLCDEVASHFPGALSFLLRITS
jgi:hypothetical protein